MTGRPIVNVVSGLSPATLISLAANALERWGRRPDSPSANVAFALVTLTEAELVRLRRLLDTHGGKEDAALAGELEELVVAFERARRDPFVRRPQG